MKFFLWVGSILRSSSSMIVPRFPLICLLWSYWSRCLWNGDSDHGDQVCEHSVVHEDDDKTTVRQSLPSVYNWKGSFTGTLLLSPNTKITCNQQSKKFSVINANPSFWLHTSFSVWRLLSDLEVSELSCQCKQVSTLAVDPEIHAFHAHFSKSQDWITLLVQKSDPVKTLAGLMQPPPVSFFCTADSPGGLGREGERGCCCGEEQCGHISTVSLKQFENRPK